MAEKRLIDAYDLAEIIENMKITIAGKPARWDDAKVSVLREISQAPDIDAVEVVRCKDCEHSTLIFGTYVCDNIESPWYNDEFDIDVGANDFCSYGKRKEGAEE